VPRPTIYPNPWRCTNHFQTGHKLGPMDSPLWSLWPQILEAGRAGSALGSLPVGPCHLYVVVPCVLAWSGRGKSWARTDNWYESSCRANGSQGRCHTGTTKSGGSHTGLLKRKVQPAWWLPVNAQHIHSYLHSTKKGLHSGETRARKQEREGHEHKDMSSWAFTSWTRVMMETLLMKTAL